MRNVIAVGRISMAGLMLSIRSYARLLKIRIDLSLNVCATLSFSSAILAILAGWSIAWMVTLLSIGMLWATDCKKTAATVLVVHAIQGEKRNGLRSFRYDCRN